MYSLQIGHSSSIRTLLPMLDTAVCMLSATRLSSTRLKKGHSYLKHKSWSIPAHGSPSSLRPNPVSSSHAYNWPTLRSFDPHSLLLSPDPPPSRRPSLRLALTIFETKLFAIDNWTISSCVLFHPARPVKRFGEPIKWVDTNRYLGSSTRYTTNLVATHQSGLEHVSESMGMQGPPWLGRVISTTGTESCFISSSSASWRIMYASRGGPLPAPMSGVYRCYNPSVFASLLVPVVRK